MPRKRLRIRICVSWLGVPRVVWELIAGLSTKLVLCRLRRVCTSLRQLRATWDTLVLDSPCLGSQIQMCVGSHLLHVQLSDEFYLPFCHLRVLADAAPNLESLSASFGEGVFVEGSVLQRFARLKTLGVSFEHDAAAMPQCFPRLESLRGLTVEGTCVKAEAKAEALLERLFESGQQLESLRCEIMLDGDLISACASMRSLKHLRTAYDGLIFWEPLVERLQDFSIESLELLINACSEIPEYFVEAFPLWQEAELVAVSSFCRRMVLKIEKDPEDQDCDLLTVSMEQFQGWLNTAEDVDALNCFDIGGAVLVAETVAAFSLCCRVEADFLMVQAPEAVRKANVLMTGAQAGCLHLGNFDVRLSRAWAVCPLEVIVTTRGARVTGRKPRHLRILHENKF